jgi:hypothetical protein
VARKTKKQQTVIMWTSSGQYIPCKYTTDIAIREFVQIQRYRYHNHVPAGPSGGRAHYIESADLWESEAAMQSGEGKPIREIDLDGIPSNPDLPTSN